MSPAVSPAVSPASSVASAEPDEVVVSGAGRVVLGGAAPGQEERLDPLPFLRVKKSRKYLGRQDSLAVVAAGRALRDAGLLEGAPREPLGERVGLYLGVGYISFLYDDIAPVMEASAVDGGFSHERFATTGYQAARPLIAFRCLPNMAAHHVSVSFGIRGPYSVAYPDAGQLFCLLEEAIGELRAGRIDAALLGGVAYQKNFLVEHHLGRLDPPTEASSLRDAGAFLVLETKSRVLARGGRPRARRVSSELLYEPFDPRLGLPPQEESLFLEGGGVEALASAEGELGPASFPAALSAAIEASEGAFVLRHRLRSRTGIRARSEWEGIP